MTAHMVRAVRTTSTPRVLCAVAYDPVDTPTAGHGYLTRAGTWSVRTTRRRGSSWETVREATATGVGTAAAWSAIRRSGASSSRSYIACTAVADCLTLLGFWAGVDANTISLRSSPTPAPCSSGRSTRRRRHPLILASSPAVVGWTEGAAEYRAVQLSNHLPMPLVDCARWAGVSDPPECYTAARPTGHAYPDSAWTVGALTAIYHRLFAWWQTHQAGRWADTIGAAAWSMWRTTIGDTSVLEHDHADAIRHESAAVYGGRAQLFWFGSAGDTGVSPAPESVPAAPTDRHLSVPVYKLDIRSMYASLLATRPFPTRLLHRVRVKTPLELSSALRSVMAVATVRVRVVSPRLPNRGPNGRVTYPVGEWTTTLTTPELFEAIEREEVTAVYETWAYESGRPFQTFAERLLALRETARESGDNIGGTLCKLLANALGGRLARTGKGWVSEPDGCCRQRWGSWSEVEAVHTRERVGTAGDPLDPARWIDRVEGVVTQLRGVAGVRQRHVVTGDRPGGLTACYAHLTAYGRVELARLMGLAGRREVLWCDTDGLLVTQTGLDSLRAAGEPMEGAAGTLRIEGRVSSFRGRTPKHYCADGAWTLAGYRDDFGTLDNGRVRGYQTCNPVTAGEMPSADGIPTTSRVYTLDTIPLSGTPGLDAWLIPPVASAGRLIQPTDAMPDELRGWDYD